MLHRPETEAALSGVTSRPRRIAIASGKGGVGKTWLAITLAHALASTGRKILLFDGDFGLANIDIQLGLTPSVDLSNVIAGHIGLEEAVALFVPGNFSILAGRSGSGSLSALAPHALDALLTGLGDLPYSDIVLDLGAGLDHATRRMAAWADVLLAVATDEPTSLTDAYAVLKLHASDRPGATADVRIVVNQAASRSAGERTFATLSRASQHFLGRSPALAGIIRRDEHVRDAIRRQQPLLTRHPSSPAADDVRFIAERLL